MLACDSSFLVSLFLPYDENHQKAVERFSKIKEEVVVMPDLALFETLTVILYKENHETADFVFNSIRKNSIFQIAHFSKQELEEILALFLSQKKKLSMVDASVLYLSKHTGAPILAFDRDLVRA